mgnify:CR=1 FL=1
MKVVFLLFDSLNRHALSCYEPGAPPTPNFDRLAARSVVFDRHFVGSLPCMPGPTQHHWLHALPKCRAEVGERINLTFRLVAIT